MEEIRRNGVRILSALMGGLDLLATPRHTARKGMKTWV